MLGLRLQVVFLLCAGQLLGCLSAPPAKREVPEKAESAGQFHRFLDRELSPVDTTGYVKKVDNFTIIFDPSASMTQVYEPSYDCVACHIDHQSPEFSQNHAVLHGGEEFEGEGQVERAMNCVFCHHDTHFTKFFFARELALAINQSIPDIDLTGTLRTFGSPAYTSFSYGFKKNDNTKYLSYNRKEYGRAIEKIWEADGVSPLAMTLRATAKDWFSRRGRIAVIIISDGMDMDKREVFAAQDLKDRYGENICIYTILIGNDPAGRKVMEEMTQDSDCSMALNGDHLLDHENLKSFIRDVFLEREVVDTTQDRDGDGVPDCCDACPETEKGEAVSDNGCLNLVMMADVLFDFDKFTLKPEGVAAMEKVLGMLEQYPFLDLHISGHTDNYGSMAYNIALSKQRALTGKKYLESKGIDPKRITISWHSYTQPVASNETAEGRSENRRLEFKFTKRQ